MIISRMLTLLFLYVIRNCSNNITTLNTELVRISLLHKTIYKTYSFLFCFALNPHDFLVVWVEYTFLFWCRWAPGGKSECSCSFLIGDPQIDRSSFPIWHIWFPSVASLLRPRRSCSRWFSPDTCKCVLWAVEVFVPVCVCFRSCNPYNQVAETMAWCYQSLLQPFYCALLSAP